MAYPAKISLVEVGPRDGLQNEATILSPAQRAELIRGLQQAGLTRIEVGSFVSPKWVPQMADTGPLLQQLLGEASATAAAVDYPVLVPNMQGYQAALAAGAREIAIFAAASESFSKRNINCTIAESLARFTPVLEAAHQDDIRVRGYLSCVMGCPYEGAVAADRVVDLAEQMLAMGCYELSLGDTIGVGVPAQTEALFAQLIKRCGAGRLAGHFHNTYGQAIANIHAAASLGIATFDTSIAGLGGCPYAKGASGNVATEDVAYMFAAAGYDTGVNLDALFKVGAAICQLLGRQTTSSVARARAAA